jgi:hypothetical protein
LRDVLGLEDKGEYFNIDGKSIYKDLASFAPSPNVPQIGVKLTQGKASVQDPDTGKSMSFNHIRQIQVDGLAGRSSKSGYGLLLSENDRTVISKSRDRGNFIGARQDTVGAQSIAEIATMGLTALTRVAGDSAAAWWSGQDVTTGGSLSTAITAGETASQNSGMGNVNDFGKILARDIRPLSLPAVQGNLANNFGTLTKLSGIKENLQIALDMIGDDNNFGMSDKTKSSQQYSSKLQALIKGLVFKQTFDESELMPMKGKGPYTLYNMADDLDMWKHFTLQSQNNDDSEAGSYAQDPKDFVPIYSIDPKTGDISAAPVKSFPWTRSGFKGSGNFNNYEQNQNKQRAIIKVLNNKFTGQGISFPYKTVTAPLFDTNLNRFTDNPEGPFDIVDVGGVIDKSNPNPFNELNYLRPLSAIRTPNAQELGAGIAEQAKNNKGEKFSLEGLQAYVVSRMDRASEQISNLGITDDTQAANIYKKSSEVLQPSWMTPVFAELYKTKSARAEQEQNAEVAGKAGAVDKFTGTLTSAHRTSLARILHKVALKNSVGMVGPMPNKSEDIYKNLEMLGRTASMPRANTEVIAKANAARSLFSTILNDQGTKLQTWIQSAGFDLNNVFEDPTNIRNEVKRKLPKQGMIGKELQTVYYQFKADAQKKLSATFQTLLESETGGMKFKQFSSQNKLNEDTQNSLKLEGAQEASRDSNGNIVYKSLKENIPKTYQDIANFALNPYNRFPDNISRGTYLDKLSEVVAMGKDKNNRPLYTGKVKTKVLEDLLNLKTFYTGTTGSFKGLDYYTNTGIKPADAMKELDPAATDIQTVYEELLAKTAASHMFLTQNSMGTLPTFDELSKTVANNKTEDEKKPQKPQAVSKGGVIYASTGTLVDYQPRGTDTVPAMLTPGEFVVNRASTQKHLPLLKAINNGATNPQALSKGGIAYLSEGGVTDGESLEMQMIRMHLSDLGNWSPDQQEIAALKQEANDIANKKKSDRACIDKIYGEERKKDAVRLEALNSDEYKTSQNEAEANRRAAVAKRAQTYAQIKILQDGFSSQLKADLSKIKEETGLQSMTDIFTKFPRLKIEHEFTKKTGDITQFAGADVNDDVKAFQQTIDKIALYASSGNFLGDSTEFAKIDTFKNMFDIKALGPSKDGQIHGPFGAVAPDPQKSSAAPKPERYSKNKALTKEAIQSAIEQCKAEELTAQSKQFGGMIYASQGTLVNYQPRGTDTVPAMLTPGEFVVNRQATQRNLPLLKSINSNRYQTGGIVQPQYHDIGSMVSGASKAIGGVAAVGIKLDTSKLGTEINKVLSDGAKMLSGVLQLSGQDRSALSSFGDNFRALLSQMSQINIPPEIRFSMQPVQVNITGAQGLTEAAERLIDGAIKRAFENFISENDFQGTVKKPK